MQRHGPEELMAEAERKMSPSWWEKITSMGTLRYDEAADLYTKAYNMYKRDKNWDAAAAACIKAAKAYSMAQSSHDAACAYVNASHCYKQIDVKEAIGMLERAIEMFSDSGRFGTAGKHQQEIAEIYEGEGQKEEALTWYQIAADTFQGENNQTSNYSKCLIKVATLSADIEDFQKAVEIFEKVAESSTEGLSRWAVKDYLFKAGLCKLALGDLVAMRQSLVRYPDMYPPFQRDREYKILEDLTEACENFDAEFFTSVIAEYDSVTQLDPWKAAILAKVKKSLIRGGDLGGESDGDDDGLEGLQ